MSIPDIILSQPSYFYLQLQKSVFKQSALTCSVNYTFISFASQVSTDLGSLILKQQEKLLDFV